MSTPQPSKANYPVWRPQGEPSSGRMEGKNTPTPLCRCRACEWRCCLRAGHFRKNIVISYSSARGNGLKNKVTPPATDPLNSLFFSIAFLLIRQPLQDFVPSSFSEHVHFVLVFTVFQEVQFVIPMVSSIFFEFPNFEKTFNHDSFNHQRTSSSKHRTQHETHINKKGQIYISIRQRKSCLLAKRLTSSHHRGEHNHYVCNQQRMSLPLPTPPIETNSSYTKEHHHCVCNQQRMSLPPPTPPIETNSSYTEEHHHYVCNQQ